MKNIYIAFIFILLASGCSYVFTPQVNTATNCKDPIYAQAYDHADEVLSYLPKSVDDLEKGAMRQALVNQYLDKFGANNPLDAQMDARREAMTAYFNKFGKCPTKVSSGPLGNGFYVVLEGVDGKKWNYDTTTSGTLTESKW